jgi:hypothetical protein
VHAPKKLHPIHAWHVDVAQQDIHVTLFKFAQSSFTVGSGLYAITQALELLLDYESQIGFVFDDKKSGALVFTQIFQSPFFAAAIAAGKLIVKVVPTLTADWTSRRPPCSVTIP